MQWIWGKTFILGVFFISPTHFAIALMAEKQRSRKFMTGDLVDGTLAFRAAVLP